MNVLFCKSTIPLKQKHIKNLKVLLCRESGGLGYVHYTLYIIQALSHLLVSDCVEMLQGIKARDVATSHVAKYMPLFHIVLKQTAHPQLCQKKQ